ncbi:hypothetical protein EJB05_01329, partial [Eragrostis curvula]
MASHDPSILLATTPQGNTCLHISSNGGHEGFCKAVVVLNEFLLGAVNAEQETPRLTGVKSGHPVTASFLLRCCHDLQLTKLDNLQAGQAWIGHRKLAMELIAAEPALSHQVNDYNESPMFIAVMRGFTDEPMVTTLCMLP